MIGRLPDFVIIGAMKAATSTLHSQLGAQPGIFMSTPKEPNFFSDAENWGRGMDWYRGLFARAAPGDLCGESSTHYTKLPDLPDALPRIAELLPDARFLYLMRHPIDRLISHYSHTWLERSIEMPIDAAILRHPELVDYGRYAMQIGPWLAAVGKGRVLPIFMERMASSPQAELERVCRFLGHGGSPVWQAESEAENVSRARLRDSAIRDAVVNHPIVTAIRHNLVPRGVRNWIKRAWQMREKPEIGAELLAQVTAIFDDDLAELGPMLGATLTCASFKNVVREAPLDWA